MMRYDIRVKGLVQGVAFRASTKDKALSLGLKGYVRNEPDGSVFIAAEGDQGKLNELLDWCREGPPAARVDDLEYDEGSPEYFNKFVISH